MDCLARGLEAGNKKTQKPTERRGPEARPDRVKCPKAVALPPLRRAALGCQGLGTRSITCKRSSLSCQGWSSGQALRSATGSGPPLETAAGSAHKVPGCLGPNGRLLYLSYSAPTAAATAILGSHCGGRRGRGGGYCRGGNAA